MSNYDIIPGVNAESKFAPPVRAAIAAMSELKSSFAHLVNGKLTIDGSEVGQPSPAAGPSTVGWAKAVFIPNGATYPIGTPPYTIVVEEA